MGMCTINLGNVQHSKKHEICLMGIVFGSENRFFTPCIYDVNVANTQEADYRERNLVDFTLHRCYPHIKK